MKRNQGGVLAKYLLLIFALALLIAYWWWRDHYGLFGPIKPMPQSTQDRIVFVRQDSNGQTNLFLVKADGSDLRQLTEGKGGKRTPAWSPDGTQLCYAAEPDESGTAGRTYQLFLLGGGGPVQATHGSIAKDSPQWRPDGKLIAFLTGGTIKVIEPNGDNLKQVYPVPHRETGEEHAQEGQEIDTGKRPPIRLFRWSPNNSTIAAVQMVEGEHSFVQGKSNWWQEKENGARNEAERSTHILSVPESIVMLPSIEGGEPYLLAQAGANMVGMDWFPDGKRFAVTLSASPNGHGLLVYRTDEKYMAPRWILAAKNYTAAPENPAVSPDGKQVAFEVWRMDSAENRELLGIAALPTESNTTLIINRPADVAKIPLKIKGSATRPQWSPDGTRLLYSMPGPSGRDLWVANADGSNPVNLTRGQGDNFDAVWSPARK